ncbi:unnamed protein product [Mucor hiemalis]
MLYVPLFKHFSSINKGIIFSWCESKVLSYSNSQMVPGVWNNTTQKLFADGIGREHGIEITIMESSGPQLIEYVEHSMGDLQKLSTMTNNYSRGGILKYQDALFNTAKG